MFRRIVIPLDGSEAAERAVPYGVELARSLGIPLHLVRVVDEPESMWGVPGDGIVPPAGAAELAEMAVEYLDHVRAWLVERGLAVTTEVRRGDHRSEIVTATHAHDLLILASQGESASSDLPLAIAADAFDRSGSRPILLVPPGEA
jgi:nucleotide-binding universal stress UspA family protein